MNIRPLIITGALATLVAGGSAVAANAQVYPNYPVAQTYPNGQVYQNRPYGRRGERGSARNIVGERRRLERVIDSLQHDQRDYGGHREQAIDLLQQARAQLDQAVQYDATHPNG